MNTVIETRGLEKRFGQVRALDGLDLDGRGGEVHGFLGPNGAGKSTTIRVLLGLLRAERRPRRLSAATRGGTRSTLHRRLAYVPGDVSLWPKLTGGETIDLLGRLRGGPRPEAQRDELIERFELDPTQEGPRLLEGQPAEGGARRGARAPRRAAHPRRADGGLDPLMEAVVPASASREARARGRDRAAVEPHPGRGRGALRPGEHHPRRRDGRVRHPRRDAAAHPHLGLRRRRRGRRTGSRGSPVPTTSTSTAAASGSRRQRRAGHGAQRARRSRRARA